MLLPGLEEGLEPELYDEVIDILDPDLLDTIAGADLDSIERNGIIWKQDITDKQISPQISPQISLRIRPWE